MVVSAAKTTEKEILLDVDEATKMLRLLQYKDNDPIILCAYGEKTNLYHPPRTTSESYDWQTVTTLAAKNGRAGLFNSVQKDLVKEGTNNFGFISSPGGTAKISRKEITKSRLLVYEIDERLTAGWYVCSGQRKRYLKSIIKDKKG